MSCKVIKLNILIGLVVLSSLFLLKLYPEFIEGLPVYAQAPCGSLSCEIANPAGCDCGGIITAAGDYCCADGVNPGVYPNKATCQSNCFCGDGSCDFPEISSAAKTEAWEIACDLDCGCNNNGICEFERGENFWNCPLDCPAVAGIDCLCNELPRHSEGQGLVPCGRNYDDPDTDYICECCPCTFCHTFLLMKRVIDFGTKQVLPALLVLVVIVAGVLYLVGGFSGSLISQAQGILKIMAIGAVIVLAGWIVVNTTLYAITGKQTDTGVAEIFAGSWDEITCDYGKTCTTSKCGDGIVQKPNWGGVDEECEINEKWEGFKARAGALGDSEDVDGVVDPNPIPGTTKVGRYDYFASLCMCKDCILGPYSVDVCCNNGRLDYGEICDQTVSEADWLATPYIYQDVNPVDGFMDGDMDKDGDVDSDDYYSSICLCENDCTYTAGEILDTFFDGSSTFTLNIPVGGSDSSAHIRLPVDTKVCTTSLEIDFTGPAIEKTPYIWIPLSDRDRLVQIDTDNEEFVAMYGKEDGVITCTAGTYCIWDCTANCATNNPTWTERGEDTDCNFDNPSRITVILDQQVWVANRDGGSVTQLIRTNGDFECKGTYSDIGGGSGPRGVTFDVEGNIWVGAYSTGKICKYKPDGTLLFCRNIGCRTYGMIADSYGYVWTSDTVNNRVCRIDINDCNVGSCPISTTAVGDIYGIGMDNESDIWIGRHGSTKVYEIDGADNDGNPIGSITENCGALPVITGVAVDGNNNVWGSNHNGDTTYMIEAGDCTKSHSFANVCPLRDLPHGVAIDGDNNAWVVCRKGEVIKLKFDGVNIVKILDRDLNTACNSGTGGGASYNYSDMTGFRTPGLSLCIGAACFPFSTTIALTGFEKELQAALAGCSGGVAVACDARFSPPYTNCCDVPIEVKAVLGGGQYDLYNLDIKYNPP